MIPKVEMPSDSSGFLFDHYAVEKTLGRGAMGVVYLARDLRIGRRVALKTIPKAPRGFATEQDEQEFVERFRREAELCGSLIHPNIITLYEVGWEGNRISYLAMEYVEGESLLSLLSRVGTLELDAALKLIDDVLQGLAYAHGRNVVHRDVKPANILVSVQGDAKVADFGVARYARSVGATLTNEGQLIGTPYYMSPELIAGRPLDGQSDLFSVGVMLYEMLGGKKPFEGGDLMDVLHAIVNAPAPDIHFLRPDLPRWVGSVIRRLLAKRGADRFASAADASREIRRLMQADRSGTNPLRDLGRKIPVMSNLAPEETPTAPIQLEMSMRKRLRRMNRSVPTPVGLAVIIALLGGMMLSVGFVQRELHRSDSPSIQGPSSDELAEKQALLREARMLYESGQYEESLASFQKYLARYPWSLAARTGEQLARTALQEQRERQAMEIAEKERQWRAIQAQRERNRRDDAAPRQ